MMEKISFAIDSGNQAMLHNIEPGMYFARNGEWSELRMGPLNEFRENRLYKFCIYNKFQRTSSLNLLGWYRRNINETLFDVQNGTFELQKAHHVKLTDCKKQKYESTLDAKFYASL